MYISRANSCCKYVADKAMQLRKEVSYCVVPMRGSLLHASDM